MGKVPTTPEDFAKLQAAEQRRVRDILRRDKEEYGREIARAAAEIEFEKGKTVSIVDIAMEPTEEWKAKGRFETFTPRLEDGTVKTVKAYRRTRVSTATKLCLDGKITEAQLAACLWFSAIYDEAGVSGRYKTSLISLAGNVGGTNGAAQHPMALHEHEARYRDLYRRARKVVNVRFIQVFEYVVLEGMSLRAAANKARKDNSRLLPKFRQAAQSVADFCDEEGIDVLAKAKDG